MIETEGDADHLLGGPRQHPLARDRTPSESAATRAASRCAPASRSSSSTAAPGLRLLGKTLLKEMPLAAQLFFSHVHWDHIQGFPFFDPAFVAGNVIHLYGGNNVSRTLEETLAGQMDHPSFPVHLTEMGAKMHFHDLFEGQPLELDAGDGTKARHQRGARQPPERRLGLPRRPRRQARRVRDRHRALRGRRPEALKLAKGADVLIYDSQYTPEEYAGAAGGGPKIGWGHSTFDEAVKLAKAARREAARPPPPRSDAERRRGRREGAARARALPELRGGARRARHRALSARLASAKRAERRLRASRERVSRDRGARRVCAERRDSPSQIRVNSDERARIRACIAASRSRRTPRSRDDAARGRRRSRHGLDAYRAKVASLRAYRESLAGLHALDRETERDLARRWIAGDQRAGAKIVEAVCRSCLDRARVPPLGRPARGHHPAGQPRACSRPRRSSIPKSECRLATYAAYWIRAEIREYVVRAFRVVRLGTTKGERRALRAYRTTKDDRPRGARAGLGPLARSACASFCRSSPRARSSLDASTNDMPPAIERLAAPRPRPRTKRRVTRSPRSAGPRGPRGGRRARRARADDREGAPHDGRAADARRSSATRLGVSKERVRQLEERARAKLRGELSAARRARRLTRRRNARSGGASTRRRLTDALGATLLAFSGRCGRREGVGSPRWAPCAVAVARRADAAARRISTPPAPSGASAALAMPSALPPRPSPAAATSDRVDDEPRRRALVRLSHPVRRADRALVRRGARHRRSGARRARVRAGGGEGGGVRGVRGRLARSARAAQPREGRADRARHRSAPRPISSPTSRARRQRSCDVGARRRGRRSSVGRASCAKRSIAGAARRARRWTRKAAALEPTPADGRARARRAEELGGASARSRPRTAREAKPFADEARGASSRRSTKRLGEGRARVGGARLRAARRSARRVGAVRRGVANLRGRSRVASAVAALGSRGAHRDRRSRDRVGDAAARGGRRRALGVATSRRPAFRSSRSISSASRSSDAKAPLSAVVLRGGQIVTVELGKSDDAGRAAATPARRSAATSASRSATATRSSSRSRTCATTSATISRRSSPSERDRGPRKLAGVVLDLRGNGGGSTDGALGALSLFLPGAPLFAMKRRDGTVETDRAPVPRERDRWTGPVATFVDGTTASAAEMIAGALAAYKRGPDRRRGDLRQRLRAGVRRRRRARRRAAPDHARLRAPRRHARAARRPRPADSLSVPRRKATRSRTSARRSSPHSAPPWRGPDLRDHLVSPAAAATCVAGPRRTVGPCRDADVCKALGIRRVQRMSKPGRARSVS